MRISYTTYLDHIYPQFNSSIPSGHFKISLSLYSPPPFKIAHWIQLELSLYAWQTNISHTPEEKWCLSIQQLLTANHPSARVGPQDPPFICFGVFTDLAFVQIDDTLYLLHSGSSSMMFPGPEEADLDVPLKDWALSGHLFSVIWPAMSLNELQFIAKGSFSDQGWDQHQSVCVLKYILYSFL